MYRGVEMKTSAVYKITNTVTCDFYIGSSKDVKRRWVEHKCPSVWKNNPNKQLYKDIQNYGIDKFDFQILEEVEPESLKEAEQQFIEKMHPTYNSNRAKGWDIERHKETRRKDSKEFRETHKEYHKQYDNQQCLYNGQTITLGALRMRFKKLGIVHSAKEAKKYLVL